MVIQEQLQISTRGRHTYNITDQVAQVIQSAGITTGSLLDGVKYWPDGATTWSLVMRSRTGTVRWIEAEHSFAKLERYTRIAYR